MRLKALRTFMHSTATHSTFTDNDLFGLVEAIFHSCKAIILSLNLFFQIVEDSPIVALSLTKEHLKTHPRMRKAH